MGAADNQEQQALLTQLDTIFEPSNLFETIQVAIDQVNKDKFPILAM